LIKENFDLRAKLVLEEQEKNEKLHTIANLMNIVHQLEANAKEQEQQRDKRLTSSNKIEKRPVDPSNPLKR